jgi:hypothetical protein
MILDEDVASRAAIQSRHRCLNHNACNVSRRKTQLTKSKALEISSLMKSDGRLALCSPFITFWAYRKLSQMHLFFMKVFWHPETSSFNLGASLSARIFVIILARLLIRLMGRKSLIVVASFVFGMRTTFSSLTRNH